MAQIVKIILLVVLASLLTTKARADSVDHITWSTQKIIDKQILLTNGTSRFAVILENGAVAYDNTYLYYHLKIGDTVILFHHHLDPDIGKPDWDEIAQIKDHPELIPR